MNVVTNLPVIFTIMICEHLQDPRDQPQHLQNFLENLQQRHPFTTKKKDVSQPNCYVAEIYFKDSSLTLEELEEFFFQQTETLRVQPTILERRMPVDLAA